MSCRHHPRRRTSQYQYGRSLCLRTCACPRRHRCVAAARAFRPVVRRLENIDEVTRGEAVASAGLARAGVSGLAFKVSCGFAWGSEAPLVFPLAGP